MVQQTRKAIAIGMSVDVVPTWKEAIVEVQKRLTKESLLLVKGSNGMGLKNLVGALVEQ
jgi:UDP-N-acetylmuramyl pentapeptide synthase